jgi:hypothetical protein
VFRMKEEGAGSGPERARQSPTQARLLVPQPVVLRIANNIAAAVRCCPLAVGVNGQRINKGRSCGATRRGPLSILKTIFNSTWSSPVPAARGLQAIPN